MDIKAVNIVLDNAINMVIENLSEKEKCSSTKDTILNRALPIAKKSLTWEDIDTLCYKVMRRRYIKLVPKSKDEHPILGIKVSKAMAHKGVYSEVILTDKSHRQDKIDAKRRMARGVFANARKDEIQLIIDSTDDLEIKLEALQEYTRIIQKELENVG